jgi:phosphoribosyl 1,2-cyclic phosphodiesterase
MRVGCLAVDACATLHDAAEPVAVRVSHPASGQRYGIACDVGHVTPDLAAFLRGCTGLVLEANHDADMLASGPYPPALQARIAGRLGHLSNAAAARLAASLAHAGLSFVVLAHLSEQCNRPDLARRVVADALARCQFSGALLVAHQDRPLPVVPLRVEPQYSLQLH